MRCRHKDVLTRSKRQAYNSGRKTDPFRKVLSDRLPLFALRIIFKENIMYKIGFIGAGNMGGALAIAASETLGGENVLIYDNDAAKCAALSEKYGFSLAENANELAAESGFIVLAVKPNIIRGVAASIKEELSAENKCVVTIAAGVAVSAIREAVEDACPVMRIMPNTPVAVGKGTILINKGSAGEEKAGQFLDIMAAAGSFEEMPESLFDITTAVNGCAPAYTYIFIESMADGAVQMGLPRDTAIRLAAQTVLGSAAMVLETGEHPDKLKDNVCSPGGSTIAGVAALEENGFRHAAAQAVVTAAQKNSSLGK